MPPPRKSCPDSWGGAVGDPAVCGCRRARLRRASLPPCDEMDRRRPTIPTTKRRLLVRADRTALDQPGLRRGLRPRGDDSTRQRPASLIQIDSTIQPQVAQARPGFAGAQAALDSRQPGRTAISTIAQPKPSRFRSAQAVEGASGTGAASNRWRRRRPARGKRNRRPRPIQAGADVLASRLICSSEAPLEVLSGTKNPRAASLECPRRHWPRQANSATPNRPAFTGVTGERQSSGG